MTADEPILIVGTGAIACLFAARLSAAGRSVFMLGSWQAAIDAINRDGVHTLDENGVERIWLARAVSNPEEIRNIRYALVLVKAYQTRSAAEKLRTCLSPDGLALSIQNGLGNLEEMSGILGADRCAAGTTTLGASLLMPGLIRPFDKGEVFLADHPRLAPLVDLLRTAGFRVQVLAELGSLVWGKLVINCAANPLSVLLEMTNGEIVNNPSSRELAMRLADEAAQVARAMGISLAYDDPEKQVQKVLQDTSTNRTSMHQDYHRGSAGSEIDAINGAVVAAAAKLGIPVPYNEAVTLLVKARFETQTERKLLV